MALNLLLKEYSPLFPVSRSNEWALVCLVGTLSPFWRHFPENPGIIIKSRNKMAAGEVNGYLSCCVESNFNRSASQKSSALCPVTF